MFALLTLFLKGEYNSISYWVVQDIKVSIFSWKPFNIANFNKRKAEQVQI
jgi:hypothetical protein